MVNPFPSMIKIQHFVFNLFQVNTFLLYDETRECVIIDPGCYENAEKKQLSNFIEQEGLQPVGLYNTHTHIDHIVGVEFIASKYNLAPRFHKDGLVFYERFPVTAESFGMEAGTLPKPGKFIEDNEIIKFGNASLEVFYAPGHADGSICFYNEKQKFVIVGDVLFNQSIGRTDLPTGDFELLQKSIRERLFTLPEEVKVLSGHGPETTIGHEKMHNPFVGLI
jgi:glyoxylase-like metal-dependent hydrolase (beta-lactamase superfamily II)